MYIVPIQNEKLGFNRGVLYIFVYYVQALTESMPYWWNTEIYVFDQSQTNPPVFTILIQKYINKRTINILCLPMK